MPGKLQASPRAPFPPTWYYRSYLHNSRRGLRHYRRRGKPALQQPADGTFSAVKVLFAIRWLQTNPSAAHTPMCRPGSTGCRGANSIGWWSWRSASPGSSTASKSPWPDRWRRRCRPARACSSPPSRSASPAAPISPAPCWARCSSAISPIGWAARSCSTSRSVSIWWPRRSLPSRGTSGASCSSASSPARASAASTRPSTRRSRN